MAAKKPVFHLRWTKDRDALFLEHLAASSNVAASERAAMMMPGTARRRARKDEAFDTAWRAALREGYSQLEHAMLERALNGTPVVRIAKDGTRTETIEYSDRIAMTLLNVHRAKVTEMAVAADGEAARERLMVEGTSGLLAVSHPARRPRWEPSLGRLTWPGGATATLYGAAEPEGLRGPEHSHAWADEIGKWAKGEAAWSNLMLGLRLGTGPRVVATTTPRPVALVRGLIAAGGTVVTRGATADNADHLPDAWMAAMTPADMDFVGLKAAAAREIALAFGVPPMLLGLPGDNTYANYSEANRALWRQTVVPLVGRIAGALEAALGGWWPGLRLVPDLDAVPALAADREALWRQVAAADFLSVAEKRQMLGFAEEAA